MVKVYNQENMEKMEANKACQAFISLIKDKYGKKLERDCILIGEAYTEATKKLVDDFERKWLLAEKEQDIDDIFKELDADVCGELISDLIIKIKSRQMSEDSLNNKRKYVIINDGDEVFLCQIVAHN